MLDVSDLSGSYATCKPLANLALAMVAAHHVDVRNSHTVMTAIHWHCGRVVVNTYTA